MPATAISDLGASPIKGGRWYLASLSATMYEGSNSHSQRAREALEGRGLLPRLNTQFTKISHDWRRLAPAVGVFGAGKNIT
jgi:hypothetical protein